MIGTLCRLDSVVEGKAKGFPYRGGHLIVIRRGGSLFVYENRCPHLGVNLDFQQDVFFSHDERYLQCSMHGALFEIRDGLCISGPCRGEFLNAVPFRVENGVLSIDENFIPLQTCLAPSQKA